MRVPTLVLQCHASPSTPGHKACPSLVFAPHLRFDAGLSHLLRNDPLYQISSLPSITSGNHLPGTTELLRAPVGVLAPFQRPPLSRGSSAPRGALGRGQTKEWVRERPLSPPSRAGTGAVTAMYLHQPEGGNDPALRLLFSFSNPKF